MKRLVKKAFEVPLYHGTTLGRLKGITKAGMILPQESNGGGNIDGNEQDFDGYTFFATKISKAKVYSVDFGTGEDSEPVILELALPENSLMPDDNDCHECKTWKESADKIQQVKVLGQITDNYIKKVHFENFGEAGIVNYNGWEKSYEELKEKLEKGEITSPYSSDFEDDGWDDDLEDPELDLEGALFLAGIPSIVNGGVPFSQNFSIAKYFEVANSKDLTADGYIYGSLMTDGNIYIGSQFYDGDISGSIEFDGTLFDIRSDDDFKTLQNRENAISNLAITAQGISSFELNGKTITLEDLKNVINGQQNVANNKVRLKRG